MPENYIIRDIKICTDKKEVREKKCAEKKATRKKKCTDKKEIRKKRCAEKKEIREKKCNNWVRWLRWLCKGFTFVINIICIAWTYITNTVCVAWTYITNTVCIAWTYITNIVCVTWKVITNIIFLSFKYRFPILKAESDKHYNVFQRFKGPDKLAWPVGSAVDKASAPGEELTGRRPVSKDKIYKKLPSESPYDQLDILCEDHTQMPEKYRDWVLNIAHRHFSDTEIIIPELDTCRPSRGFSGTEITVMGRFPKDNNKVFLDDEVIPVDFISSDTCIFKIPESVPNGLKKIKIQHDGKWFSNTIEFVLCDLIGNKRSKELHLKDCPWLKLMKESNRIPLSSEYDIPRKKGFYDSCRWCSLRHPKKIGSSKR